MSRHRKGEIIIPQDKECDKIYFVVKGSLRIFCLNNSGREVTRSFAFENDFCTNLLSFSRQGINSENIQCMEDSLLFSIHREKFYKMLGDSATMPRLYYRVLEFFINHHLRHFQFMNTLSERERVADFLSRQSQAKSRIKDKIIASYLGVSPEFYSKVKSELLTAHGIS